VLPYLHGLFLDAEDAIATAAADKSDVKLSAVALAWPRCSNHNDLDPLRLHPDVSFRWIGPGQPIPSCDLVVLPGSKAVQADLAWLRQQGWDTALARHLRYGGKLIGLCGGFQMLGRWLHDPQGLEGERASVPGLGWLDCETTLAAQKQLCNVTGRLLLSTAGRYAGCDGDMGARGVPMMGYEIHAGVTTGADLVRPAVVTADGRREGAISLDGQMMGSYCHGLFDHADALAAILAWAGAAGVRRVDLAARREADIERLADAVDKAFSWDRLTVPGF
jgi:adenosylcobyric acid synthase